MKHRGWCALATFAILIAGAIVGATGAAATFPGTNGKIAFARDPDTPGSDTDIFAIDPNGQNRVALTHAPDFERHPSFSGDGEWIAFDRFVGGGPENASIWVMKQDGSDQIRLTSGPPTQDDFDPAFSPDGKRIAFVREVPSGQHIWVMNADGSGQSEITTGDDFDSSPSFSPNGQRIVFQRLDNTALSTDVWVMNANGSGQAQLTQVGGDILANLDPSWSPDGQRILFARQTSPGTDIWVMNADGSGQGPLIEAADSDFGPVFSPDAMRLAFTRNTAGVANVFTAQANGQGASPLTNDSSGFDSDPDWQPLNPPSCELGGKGTSKSFKQVTVTLTCTNENATASVAGSGKAPKPRFAFALASKAKKFAIPAVNAQIPQGTPTSVTLKIPKKGKKALKKAAKAGKKGKATITATFTDDLGQSSQASFAVKFKKKKKKK